MSIYESLNLKVCYTFSFFPGAMVMWLSYRRANPAEIREDKAAKEEDGPPFIGGAPVQWASNPTAPGYGRQVTPVFSKLCIVIEIC